MTRLVSVIVLVLLGSCFQAHPSGQRELGGDDCYACHAPDYEATATPVHRDMPQVYATTACASCHRMSSWRPALDGLHSDAFIIAQGPHAQGDCHDCHDLASELPSKLGANTNCLGCHPNSPQLDAQHVGVILFVNKPYTYQAGVPNFCLDCHPTGLRELHPEQAFARRADHAVPCGECHDRTAGSDAKGANVTCTDSRCHHTVKDSDGDDGHEDGDYKRSRGDGTSRNFCHDCHD